MFRAIARAIGHRLPAIHATERGEVIRLESGNAEVTQDLEGIVDRREPQIADLQVERVAEAGNQ